MDFRAIITGLVFAFLWSSAFTSARIIVLQALHLAVSAIRFMVAGLPVVGFARMPGQRLHLNRAGLCAIVIFGVWQNALYLGLFFVAMQCIEASFASVIASTMPLLAGLAGAIIMGRRLSMTGWIDLVAVFSGAGVILGGSA